MSCAIFILFFLKPDNNNFFLKTVIFMLYYSQDTNVKERWEIKSQIKSIH